MTHGAQTTPETIQIECGPCDRVTTYQRWGAPALFTCQGCGTTTGRTEGLTAAEVAEAREREAARKAEAPAPAAVEAQDPLENAVDTIRVWRERCERAETAVAELQADNDALGSVLAALPEQTLQRIHEHAEKEAARFVRISKLAADLRDEVRRG